jgi:stage V sporulation protein G
MQQKGDDMSIEVKVNRIHRFEDEEKSLRAFVDIEINDSLLVKGLQIMQGKNGLFVSMPRQKGKDNKWYEVVRMLTPEVRTQISSIVLSAYQDKEAAL